MMCRLLMLIIVLVSTTGCQMLDTTYGSYRGPSINGIRVFVELLRDKGHRVDVWPSLNERLYEDYEVIIVFHNEFSGPETKSVEEIWSLAELGACTKILYIGRDLDVAADYWNAVSKQYREKGDQKNADLAASTATDVRSETTSDLSRKFKDEHSNWFFDIDGPSNGIRTVKHVTRLNEDGEVDSEIPCDWQLYRKMIPPKESIVLWQTAEDEEPVLLWSEYDSVEVFALSSGFPLLNGALITPENRKLVDALEKEIAISGKVAVITSSHLEEFGKRPSSWQFLQVFPHPWIVAHFVIFVVLFCLARFPIFGRPKRTVSRDVKRFGAHVEAMADLLRRTRQRDFALKQIQTWHDQQTKHRKRGVNKS